MRAESLVFTGSGRLTDVPSSRARAGAAEAVDVPAFGEGEWLFGTRLELSDLPVWMRPVGWLWLRLMGGPPTFPTACCTFTTRERGRARCTTRRDWLMWLPKDTPFGRELQARRFYCEPLNDPETDRQHAALFAFEEEAASELRDFLTKWRDEMIHAASSPPGGA